MSWLADRSALLFLTLQLRAQSGGAGKESQKANGKTQKSKVQGTTCKRFCERGNQGGALI
jgi:hypothetical protein